MAIQNDNTVLCKGDLKAYHEKILPYLGGNFMLGTNVSDYYSTDEKIVGVWIDGKPIYQKTFTYLSATVNSTPQFYVVANISSYNIDKIINCFGNMQWGVGGPYYSLPFTLSTNYIISVDAYLDSSEPNLILRTYRTNGTTTISDITITLQYTKTTDAANSAVTTPGCYDINFPNTWPENTEIYFGNGLYGIHKTGTITATGDERVWTNIVTLSSGVLPNLIQSGGWIKWGDEGTSHDYRYPINSCMTNLTGWGSILGAWSVMRTSDNVIALWNTSGLPRTNTPYNVWVTYTK